MQFEQSTIYGHLKSLVSFDTQNPPREIDSESPIFEYLMGHLEGFSFEFIDAGDGCLCLLAIRGKPNVLFNFHIDTVPIADGWSSDPFKLNIQNDKVVGLGACDIKGAAACILSAVGQTSGDVALLFSSDEEHGSSRAVKKFLACEYEFTKVVVAEPTMAKAVVAHRGIQTAEVSFEGISGHASEARALSDNAIHKAGKWINSATDWVANQTEEVEGLSGLPFNIGTIHGGIKANMIAGSCELKFGFRPLPGQSADDVLNHLQQLDVECRVTKGFFGPCLPAASQNFELSVKNAKAMAAQLNLELGSAVNFWTEASLFSQAGCCVFVFGPGDIAQAHTADEWVAISQLERVEQCYINILNSDVI